MSIFLSMYDSNVGVLDSNATFQSWALRKTGPPVKTTDLAMLGVERVTAFVALSSTVFVIGDDEGGVFHYNTETQDLSRLGNHRYNVTALLVLKDGRLVSADADGTVYFWDLATRTVTATIDEIIHSLHQDKYFEEPIMSLVQAPDGRLLILTASGLSTWDVANQEPQELMGYTTESLATCVTVLTDGRIAIGTAAGTIEILNEASSVWETLDGHGDAVTALCPLSRNGLASVAADGAMFVWNLESGTIVDAMMSFGADTFLKKEEDRVVYWKDGLKEWIFG